MSAGADLDLRIAAGASGSTWMKVFFTGRGPRRAGFCRKTCSNNSSGSLDSTSDASVARLLIQGVPGAVVFVELEDMLSWRSKSPRISLLWDWFSSRATSMKLFGGIARNRHGINVIWPGGPCHNEDGTAGCAIMNGTASAPIILACFCSAAAFLLCAAARISSLPCAKLQAAPFMHWPAF